jgi:hypothetical protein
VEEKVVEDQSISVLELALQYAPSRWGSNHKALLKNWDDVKQAIKYRFQDNDHLESEMLGISRSHNCSMEILILKNILNNA